MSDELTARIAEVLAAHVPTRFDVFSEDECAGEPDGRTPWTIAHQAEQVRAVLGETATEWGVKGFWFTGVTPAATERDAVESKRTQYDDPGIAVVTRTVTPWIEATS